MRRLRQAFVLAVAISFVTGSQASAHHPVDGAVRLYASDYKSLPYKFGGSSYPAYVTTAFNTGLQTGWEQNNNSRGPIFSYDSGGAGTARYTTTTGVTACDSVPWVGCANNGGLNSWNIWLRNGLVTWCESSNVTGCWLAKRVILHEAEHVTLAVVNHDSQDGTVTNMGGCSPSCAKPNPGWDSTTPKECDQAALQMKYGLQSLAGEYSMCLDHVTGAGSDGLATNITLSQTSGLTCTGLNISISGRLATVTNSNYGLLSNRNVASRTIYIDRKLDSSSTWTEDWRSLTTSNAGSGNNWTRNFSEAAANTYDYRIHFKGESNRLSPDYSQVITLTFISPCPPEFAPLQLRRAD
jgi:hypothetical protein